MGLLINHNAMIIYLIATINTKLTGENKYGVVNQLQCDDPSIDTPVDQNHDTDEDGYGVINQPQCDDLM